MQLGIRCNKRGLLFKWSSELNVSVCTWDQNPGPLCSKTSVLIIHKDTMVDALHISMVSRVHILIRIIILLLLIFSIF